MILRVRLIREGAPFLTAENFVLIYWRGGTPNPVYSMVPGLQVPFAHELLYKTTMLCVTHPGRISPWTNTTTKGVVLMGEGIAMDVVDEAGKVLVTDPNFALMWLTEDNRILSCSQCAELDDPKYAFMVIATLALVAQDLLRTL